MEESLRAALSRLAADADSGASEILPRAIDLLRAAREQGTEAVVEAARAVCASQPSMASLWNAAVAALLDPANPGTLERFQQRAARASAALRRVASDALAPAGGEPLHFTTCSFSGSVCAALTSIATSARLTVACAEGRPRFEGRRLARALSAAGVRVELFTDAGIEEALSRSAAVLVGADAITPGWFLNKTGTGQLAAAASLRGVPVLVLATRDKFISPSLAGLMSIGDRDPAEVWEAAPPGIDVRNRYFERVPMDRVTGILTDAGLLGVDMVEEVCRASGLGLTDEILDRLRAAM